MLIYSGLDTPLVTRNSSELLEKLSNVKIDGGGDCPELALVGLKAGLKSALSNSVVYLFTDATAKNPHLYNDVAYLVQMKQITVNFLITGDCNERSSEGYQVYHKIARLSGGQVYEMGKNNVKEVLLSIKDNMNQNYVVLKTIEVASGSSNTNFDVDMSLTKLKVTIVGKNPTLSLQDPSKASISTTPELSMNNLKVLTLENPKQGTWNIDANAESAYTVIISGFSNFEISYGFSMETSDKKSRTNLQPLAGSKNILTLFVSSSSGVNELSSVTITTLATSSTEKSTESTVFVEKIKDV